MPTACGVSFIPWDPRIRLEPAPPHMKSSSARILGTMTIPSGCRVPVFDLREGTVQPTETPDARAYLLVVSMDNPATGPMALGLVGQQP